MARKPYPGAVELKLTGANEASHGSGEGRRRKTGIELKAQSLRSDARQIRVGGVEGLQESVQVALEASPTHRRNHELRLADSKADKVETIDEACDLARAECPVACEGAEVEIAGRRVENRYESLLRRRDCVCFEPGQPFRRTAFAARCPEVDEAPSADGSLRAGVANHIRIAGSGGDRTLQDNLDLGGAAGRYRLITQKNDPRPDLDGGVMKPHREPLPDRLWLARQDTQLGVDPVRRCMKPGIEDDVAAPDRLLAHALSSQIECATVAGVAALGYPVLGVDRANARCKSRRAHHDAVADTDGA